MVSFVYILIPILSSVNWKVRAGLVWGLALIALMCIVFTDYDHRL